MRVHFGGLTLDDARRQILRGGADVRVSPRGFELLRLLVAERPRALSKAEIQERLWPGDVAAEGALACLVNDVRAALEDDAGHPRFIRTVHGFGYAFADDGGVVSETDDHVFVHRLLWGARELPLSDGHNEMGRERGLAVWIAHRSVSRRHARIVVSGSLAFLEDLGSKNATYVGGQRVASRADLADGASIRLGQVLLTYRCWCVDGTTGEQVDEAAAPS